MNITNRLGLPEAIVRAIKNDAYNAGDSDYTATSLLQPPRVLALKKNHKAEIVEDAEDMIYRLYGQIIHQLFERANEKDLSEKRFFSEFSGKKVSAQLDTLSLDGQGILSDYKFTTAWKFKKNQPADPDFTAQLNIQAELLRRNGITPKKLQIVGLIRDHSKRDAQKSPDSYPESPVVIMPIEMWTSEKIAQFINDRIAIHEAAKLNLPNCSQEDRWAKPDIWAVMKGQRAINGGLKSNFEDAEKTQKENPGTRIEFRPGENIRCENYCNVSQFCSQYQSMIEMKGTGK